MDASRARETGLPEELPLHAVWNGRRYGVKQVRPVFVEETKEIVVVTVYTYYF